MDDPENEITIPVFGDDLVAAVTANSGADECDQQECAEKPEGMFIHDIFDPVTNCAKFRAEAIFGEDYILFRDVILAVSSLTLDGTPPGVFQQAGGVEVKHVAIDFLELFHGALSALFPGRRDVVCRA